VIKRGVLRILIDRRKNLGFGKKGKGEIFRGENIGSSWSYKEHHF
jgi:hypothetical protein